MRGRRRWTEVSGRREPRRASRHGGTAQDRARHATAAHAEEPNSDIHFNNTRSRPARVRASCVRARRRGRGAEERVRFARFGARSPRWSGARDPRTRDVGLSYETREAMHEARWRRCPSAVQVDDAPVPLDVDCEHCRLLGDTSTRHVRTAAARRRREHPRDPQVGLRRLDPQKIRRRKPRRRREYRARFRRSRRPSSAGNATSRTRRKGAKRLAQRRYSEDDRKDGRQGGRHGASARNDTLGGADVTRIAGVETSRPGPEDDVRGGKRRAAEKNEGHPTRRHREAARHRDARADGGCPPSARTSSRARGWPPAARPPENLAAKPPQTTWISSAIWT